MIFFNWLDSSRISAFPLVEKENGKKGSPEIHGRGPVCGTASEKCIRPDRGGS